MRIVTILLLFAAIPALAHAEIRVPGVFSDYAVLQRDRPVRIWGWGGAGEQVTVMLHEQRVTAVVDETGEWDAWLAPEPAGGPYVLTIKGDQSNHDIVAREVMLGDVWLASGQSNMEFPLAGFNNAPLKDGSEEIAAANKPMIRFILQHRNVDTVPEDESPDTWSECNSKSVVRLSAIAYFFARTISEREHVTIGLIDSTVGGTPAHAWLSQGALAYSNLTTTIASGVQINNDQLRADKIRAMNARTDADLKAQGKPLLPHPKIPGDHGGAWGLSSLFNGMISPYTRFAIKGVIWYQGEQDAGGPASHYYARIFRALVSDWRNQWGQGDFPFLFVQISSFAGGPEWPTTRDAQRRALNLKNTAMAVSLDVGAEHNVHPPDKQTVAARLSQLALGSVYNEAGSASPLEFEQATAEQAGMRVWFTGSEGLTSREGMIGDFEVAGADHIFKPAMAKIQQVGGRATILASSPDVSHPSYVRYGWSAVVKSFLYNGSGMPLGTFTSEPE